MMGGSSQSEFLGPHSYLADQVQPVCWIAAVFRLDPAHKRCGSPVSQGFVADPWAKWWPEHSGSGSQTARSADASARGGVSVSQRHSESYVWGSRRPAKRPRRQQQISSGIHRASGVTPAKR